MFIVIHIDLVIHAVKKILAQIFNAVHAANIDNIYSILKASILRPFCFANFCIYVIITVVFYMGGVLHD